MNMPKMVKTKSNASKRTRKRVKKFGPLFHLGREMPLIYPESTGKRAILVHSVSTDWVGWLPVDEINIDTKHEIFN